MIRLKNSWGNIKIVKSGFSWTFFFFGFLVPIFRLDWHGLIKYLLFQFVIGIATAGIGCPIYAIVACFTYNQSYINHLIKRGYRYE
ncbi:DUF2628 domain-containing protein [Lactobacillus acetotolerans]|uniref:DUF2628 domain-containing protein n=1 Tax=Lactobacillus acetotolerans TaxID=1600 RepID=UPI002FDB7087